MIETPTERFERIQMLVVQRVANDMFLDCLEDIAYPAARQELIAVGRAGCRAAVVDMAPEYHVREEKIEAIAEAVEIAFELHFSKLVLSQLRGQA